MLLGELDLNASPAVGALQKLSGSINKPIADLKGLGAAARAPLSGLRNDVAETAIGFGSFGAFVLERAITPLGALIAAVGLAAGSIAGFKNVINLGGELNDMSLRTGETVEDLAVLREAFSEAGLGAQGVEPFLLKLQSALGGVNEEGGKTSAAFEALGLSAESLGAMNATEQITALQKGFAGIAGQADKVQAARNLFGKGGGQMLSLLGDPKVLEQAQQRASASAGLMAENRQAFDDLGDSIGALKLDFTEFFGGALAQFAPALTNIADNFGKIDWTGIGTMVGGVANVFLTLADVLSGPVAGAIGEVSSVFGDIFGSGPGGKQDFVALRKVAGESGVGAGGGGAAIASSLGKLGLGGGVGGGADPMLHAQREQTRAIKDLPRQIAAAMGVRPHNPLPV